jgi:uncharacterized protein
MTTAETMPGARAHPVEQAERIASLDVLRGFAVLGILVMNVQTFSMPVAAYTNPTNYGDLRGINFAVWLASHVFFDQKFLSLFSMMFGAGIALMTTRVAECRQRPARLHYRRMLWLLLFGLLHAYVLWYGDILVLYALCGMLVYLTRKWKPRTLLIVAAASLTFASLISVAFGLSMPYLSPQWRTEILQMWQPPPEKINAEIEAYRGGWLKQMEHRVPTAFEFQVFPLIFFLWKPAGLMLIGMALYKTGVLAAQASRTFYAWMVATGVLVGIPLVVYGAHRNFSAGWQVRYSMSFGMQWNYWGSVFVAAAWMGALMLVCKSGAWPGLRSRLAAVGQMAFSNYILQTILCTSVFYGHGFGWFGSAERWQQAEVVVGVWAVQFIVSPIWMRRFNFGPLEWVWRSLTYGARPPLRRALAVPQAAASGP